MIRKLAGAFAATALIILPAAAFAQAVQSQPGLKPRNAEVRALLASDDIDHKDDATIDFAKIAQADKHRRARIRELLAQGMLRNGGDYRAAAFIFQHGSSTDDYLLAHALAMTAVALGDRKALWIANAALDRYLMTIGQKQIFGTQFVQQNGPDQPFSQEPYDRELVPDDLRKRLGVRSLANQALFLKGLEAQRAATKPKD